MVWGFIQVGTQKYPFLMFGNVFVASGQAWYNFNLVLMPHLIDDIKIRGSQAYMLGRDLGSNAAKLYIW